MITIVMTKMKKLNQYNAAALCILLDLIISAYLVLKFLD